MAEPTTNDITTRKGVRVPSLVADPTLIKVKAIKRKYLEQMPTHGGTSNTPIPPEGIEVVGATEAFVVLLKGRYRLLKAHRNNWAEHLCRGILPREGEAAYGERLRDALDEAILSIDTYPQLFED